MLGLGWPWSLNSITNIKCIRQHFRKPRQCSVSSQRKKASVHSLFLLGAIAGGAFREGANGAFDKQIAGSRKVSAESRILPSSLCTITCTLLFTLFRSWASVFRCRVHPRNSNRVDLLHLARNGLTDDSESCFVTGPSRRHQSAAHGRGSEYWYLCPAQWTSGQESSSFTRFSTGENKKTQPQLLCGRASSQQVRFVNVQLFRDP